MSKLEKITKINDLLTEGLITKAEYDTLKKQIIESDSSLTNTVKTIEDENFTKNIGRIVFFSLSVIIILFVAVFLFKNYSEKKLVDTNVNDTISTSPPEKNQNESINNDIVNTTNTLSNDSNEKSNSSLEKVRDILNNYYHSMQIEKFNASDYFTENVKQFINLRDITPTQIDNNYETYKEEFFQPNVEIINSVQHLRSDDTTDFYSFEISYKCYRKSMNKQEECLIEIEVGLDKNEQKLNSYIERKIKNLKYL